MITQFLCKHFLAKTISIIQIFCYVYVVIINSLEPISASCHLMIRRFQNNNRCTCTKRKNSTMITVSNSNLIIRIRLNFRPNISFQIATNFHKIFLDSRILLDDTSYHPNFVTKCIQIFIAIKFFIIITSTKAYPRTRIVILS